MIAIAVSQTSYAGVVGYRATCPCGWKLGTTTETQAVAAAKRHGKKHS